MGNIGLVHFFFLFLFFFLFFFFCKCMAEPQARSKTENKNKIMNSTNISPIPTPCFFISIFWRSKSYLPMVAAWILRYCLQGYRPICRQHCIQLCRCSKASKEWYIKTFLLWPNCYCIQQAQNSKLEFNKRQLITNQILTPFLLWSGVVCLYCTIMIHVL